VGSHKINASMQMTPMAAFNSATNDTQISDTPTRARHMFVTCALLRPPPHCVSTHGSVIQQPLPHRHTLSLATSQGK